MAKLILRELTSEDESAFLEGLSLWEGEDLTWYSFVWNQNMAYSKMLEILQQESLGINLIPNRVPHTMLYGFVEGKIVGRLSVRHELNDYLRKRGGHIGYSVAPQYRRKGYASEMMKQGLEFCRQLHINPLLVTCAETNIPSRKIIEQNGGILEDITWDSEGEEMLCRFWIHL